MAKKKQLKVIVFFVAIFLFLLCLVLVNTGRYSYKIYTNAVHLKKSIFSSCNRYCVVELKEITPFKWDTVYFFDGYASKEYIYETVGYKWAPIRTGNDELAGHIVFLLENNVVCHISKVISNISMAASGKLSIQDNPKFIVYNIYNGKPNLAHFNDQFISQFVQTTIDFDMVGRWDDFEISDSNTTVKTSFTLTESGVLYGRVYFNTKDNTGFGYGQFTGVLVDNIAYCQTYSTGQIAMSTANEKIDFQMSLVESQVLCILKGDAK